MQREVFNVVRYLPKTGHTEEQTDVVASNQDIDEALAEAKRCAMNEYLTQVKDDPRPEMLEIQATEFGYAIRYGKELWMHFMVELTP